jgi:hypothetical protein
MKQPWGVGVKASDHAIVSKNILGFFLCGGEFEDGFGDVAVGFFECFTGFFCGFSGLIYDELDVIVGFIFFSAANGGVAGDLVGFLALCVHEGDFCILEDVFFGVGGYDDFFNVFDGFYVDAESFHHLLELSGVHLSRHHR